MGLERYWDGAAWTQVVRRATTVEPKRVGTGPSRGVRRDPALDLPLAGWWRRFGSGVVDSVISWLVTAIVLAIAAPDFVARWQEQYLAYGQEVLEGLQAGKLPDPSTALQSSTTTLMATLGGITAVYCIIFLGFWGATLGHRLMGVKVIKAPLPLAWAIKEQPAFTEEKPGLLRSISKGLGWALFSTGTSLFILVQLVNVLLPIWHRRKQSVTDLFASTLLVKTKRN